MREETFDLVVVGTGSGLDVAIGLVEAGWRVAVVEKGEPGGTCLNRGCIPSKMLIHSADLARAIREAETFGLHARLDGIDYPALMRRARDHVDGESNSMREALRQSENPRYFEGEGRFVGQKRLAVGDIVLSADKFLLAAGARPKIPPIPGLSEAGYWTSTDALREPTIPESLVILGGGFIATELGHFFGALGTRVTVIQKHDVLLPRDDREVSEAFTAAFSRSHDVRLQSEAVRVEKTPRGKRVTIRDKSGKEDIVECSQILVASGITPHDRIAVDYSVMPRAIFSSPQVAAVGVAEDQLRESGVDYIVGKHAYENTGMGAALAEKYGFVKILADAETRRILGCHILGPDAATLIHEVLVAMTLDAPVDVLSRTIHIHPALSEVVQRAAGNLRAPKP